MLSTSVLNGVMPPSKETDTTSEPSFGTMLRNALGDSRWSTLSPAIQRRFAPSQSPAEMLRYRGTVHWVYCSPIGALIARLLRRAAILPGLCGRNATFEFRIARDGDKIVKQRVYNWTNGEQFVFRSIFNSDPRLHEEFRGGIGMYLQLFATHAALLFRDRGYFLRVGSIRIPLPRWLSVGSFELLHTNIDSQRFQVIIRVAHPLLGTLFYQRGEFSRCIGAGE